ncbi:4-(cytidine 5'-diphospho)-2-C-methyl-D-erythritol kinase [Idiomarina tyrosinivorans]|uniref:4-diphosphocytidyl-2-C-methyl-D-erythritol kinase n=1 Tax=Idiomarina tyrosinivorans TaxID=1445662 RepID=A0A432ZRC5_9GAMM|nr:4-(cytidine 5'-diphospho)-2-C-methyl-D-erythritol kinase [Idiomarina tyrosinivorans]RUO80475.1 4-(cytidine 5'-diphospho)-2-C-methyl-D-erythritol kinase [Idiomarina tyrosinivorans]
MATLTLPSPAKLNLFLHITGRRADGYHQLQTVFQFIDLCDSLSFRLRDDDQITLSAPGVDVSPEQNLVMQAARALAQTQHQALPGVAIELTKAIPTGGGLGGGSSNAATTLLALNHLWQLQLSSAELQRIALPLGADIPIFVHGEAAFAEGIGERFSATETPATWYILAHPDVHVSTPRLYQHPDLPRQHPPIAATNWQQQTTTNDFEALVCKLYPEVANARATLLEYGPTRLTGSGACLFTQFASKAAAQQALQQLPQSLNAWVVRGLQHSPAAKALSELSE